MKILGKFFRMNLILKFYWNFNLPILVRYYLISTLVTLSY